MFYIHDNLYKQKNSTVFEMVYTMVVLMICMLWSKVDHEFHITNMHEELKLEYLVNRISKHLAVECHQGVHGTGIQPLKIYFEIKQHCNNRRTRRGCAFDVEVPRINSNINHRAISYLGPYTWNDLFRDLF